MKEIVIEEYLISRTKALGGAALKMPSQWYRHIPDRLLLLPGGKMAFVELKRPGAKPREGQRKMGKWLKKLGFEWFIIDSKISVDALLVYLTEEEY